MTDTVAPPSSRAHKAAKRYIYAWGGGRAEGDATMRDLLGGKGAGLAEMTNAGLPVPPGFTITTEACNDYFTAGEKLPDGALGGRPRGGQGGRGADRQGLRRPADPLLVSVRSGAKFSMPGMMDTVLNLGLNEETLQGLIALTGNERFGWDAYRRFIQMFGRIVMDVKGERFDHALDAAKAKLAARSRTRTSMPPPCAPSSTTSRRSSARTTGREFPSDPNEQLDLAIKAVFASWFGKRAVDYRNNQKIAHDLGTAVNVVTMVFGNMGDDSGTGRRLHPRPEHRREGPVRRVPHQRPGRGRRRRHPDRPQDQPDADRHAGGLRRVRADRPAAREALPRRPGPRVHDRARQALHAPDALGEADGRGRGQDRHRLRQRGPDHEEEALTRIEPAHVDQLLRDQFDPAARAKATRIAKGLNASPGAAVGRAVFDADTAVEWVGRGERVVLVRIETSPDDFHGMAVAQGILTARGGATSHAAVVARQIGKPCVAGCHELNVDYTRRSASANGVTFEEGDWISVDGATGEVFLGALPTVSARFEDQPELQTILGWADEVRRMQVWTNADKPEEAALARSYGAQGIGLCRTEHMFREGERLEIVRGAILVANAATRAKAKTAAGTPLTADESEIVATFDTAMGKLEVLQQGDFEGIFRAMDGLPVVIRLIDPPLHEFLPNLEEQLVKVTKAGDAATEEDRELLATIKSMHEQNPMLGLRGCRLGLMIPDFVKVQTRAILNALIAVKKAGGHPKAKIMIPLVGHVNELSATKTLLEAEAKAVEAKAGVNVEYVFGTMIEVPRGALTADEIAHHAAFFSFGTNDLTQMTFGYSRDDAEGGFLLKYVEDGILPFNPFQTLDDAVAGLMRTAVEKGRATRPDLELGICGEHGGDPESIHKCERIGLDYVSCSPFRVPVARLAAAQAVLAGVERDK